MTLDIILPTAIKECQQRAIPIYFSLKIDNNVT